jgi:hypothetical protein
MNASARTILSATVILGVIGLHNWHRSLPDLPAGNSEIAPEQQFHSTARIASPSRGEMPAAPGKPAASPETNALSDAEWQSITSQIAEADRAFVSTPSTPGIYKAFNRSRNLAFTVSAEVVEVRPRMGVPTPDGQDPPADSDWFVRLGHPQSDDSAIPASPEANRVEITRDGVLEWYVHRENGLEQGFTLESPPVGQALAAVTIDLPIETSLTPRQAAGSGAIRFMDASGQPALSYENLHAFDAVGRELPSEMLLVPAGGSAPHGSIRLVVDTTRATYPVVIDPLLTTLPLTLPEDTVVVPGIGASADHRRVVALDGNTLAVGEPLYDPSGFGPEGAVQIFYRQADGSWQFVKRIQSAFAPLWDYFGTSVDLDGDTLIVGNRAAQGTNIDEGAYIFARNEGGADNWGQVKELFPSDPNTLGFGNAVDINGDWAFVGCQRGEFLTPTGRVFIYYRNQGGANNWGQIQRILAPVPEGYDSFGTSLAVSPNGEFLLIGAPGTGDPISRGAAHLYAAEAGVFVHVAEPPPPNPTLESFGATVAISGTAFAVGASADSDDPDFTGAVYLYDYSRTFTPGLGFVYDVSAPQEIRPPEETAYKTFGHSLGLNTSYLCIGHDQAKIGVAYQPEPFFFYQRDPGNQQWILSRIMYDPQTTSASEFGSSFSLTDTHLAAAAPRNNEVQIYALDGRAGNQLGASVCIEGFTIVVGATKADGLAANSGAAYVFSKQPGNLEPWGLQRKIMANDGAGDDLFGFSASLSGDIVMIGAPEDDDRGASSGAAYAFDRYAGGISNWGQVQKFSPADTMAGDFFGYSVGIWGNRVVVGAPYHDAFGLDEGTAYLYESGIFKTKFDGFIAGPGDKLGFSVGIHEDLVIVGAPYNDFNAGVSNAGTAIVFKYDFSTGNWPEFSTLFHASPGTDDKFGWSVFTYGGHAMVGAPFRDEGGVADSGAAYLFLSVDPLTSPVDKVLVPHDPEVGNRFGSAVALRGVRAVVGSPGSGIAPSEYPGAVYVFDQHLGDWGQGMKRIPLDGQPRDLFGYALAVDVDTVVVGAPWHDGPLVDSGAAYLYEYDANDSPTDIALLPDSVSENEPVETVVGELVATDPDVQDWHTYTLVPGTGSADNASFVVTGHLLRTAAVLDYETRTSCQIRVRATDLGGLFFEKALVVQIIDVAEEDVDGDGLTRDQEDALGTSDTDRDSDDDGYEDGVEYYCMGTDPADPISGPFHLTIEVTPPSATLTWSSQFGIVYLIDQRVDLSTGTWTEVPGSQVTATGSLTSRVITLNPPSATEIFYRVRIPNCQVPPP